MMGAAWTRPAFIRVGAVTEGSAGSSVPIMRSSRKPGQRAAGLILSTPTSIPVPAAPGPGRAPSRRPGGINELLTAIPVPQEGTIAAAQHQN